MGFMRFIFLLLIILVVWRMIKNYQAASAARDSAPKQLDRQKMVQCRYCSVHLPQAQALQADNDWFCNEAHKARHLQQQ